MKSILIFVVLSLLTLTALWADNKPLRLEVVNDKGKSQRIFFHVAEVDLKMYVPANADNRRLYIVCDSTQGDCGASEIPLNGEDESSVFTRHYRLVGGGTYELRVVLERAQAKPVYESIRLEIKGLEDPQ